MNKKIIFVIFAILILLTVAILNSATSKKAEEEKEDESTVGSIAGYVYDARTEEPVADAEVLFKALGPGQPPVLPPGLSTAISNLFPQWFYQKWLMELTQKDTSRTAKLSVKTNSEGYYVIENLIVGEYLLTASAKGYYRSEKIEVLVTPPACSNVDLELYKLPDLVMSVRARI